MKQRIGSFLEGTARTETACEAGSTCLRIAQYTDYPRVSNDHPPRTAVVRQPEDPRTRRTVLATVVAEEVGTLLRIKVSDLSGPPARETLARVVSCVERGDGRFEIELEALEPHAPRFVRTSRRALRAER